ncbi:hypothetical protein QZH41_008352 [Actinostola sp. cb2023]|nr:hypothetical protein QZH41_008352 [Actinostola sp. cb2023]
MAMTRELSSFPLPPQHIHKLIKTGYVIVEDLRGVSPTQLSEGKAKEKLCKTDLEITKEEALDILQTVRKKPSVTTALEHETQASVTSSPRSRSALEMLQQEQNASCIVTFCERLDDMLGGGVPTGKITEFCGAPGIGKTQIGMQLAVDVQIPEEFGGVDGAAIYIDTEGSFIVERVADIASAAIKHLENVIDSADLDESERNLQIDSLQEFQVEKILSRIYVFRCHEYIQLIALSHLLPEFLKEHPKVKLIVLDSIAFHFRHDFEDMALRTRLLNGLAQTFIRIACEKQIAVSLENICVVLMNQMTTRIRQNQVGQSHLIPALGRMNSVPSEVHSHFNNKVCTSESWGHASTIRVVLYWENKQRFATLYKSPTKQEMTVPFQVAVSDPNSIILLQLLLCAVFLSPLLISLVYIHWLS